MTTEHTTQKPELPEAARIEAAQELRQACKQTNIVVFKGIDKTLAKTFLMFQYFFVRGYMAGSGSYRIPATWLQAMANKTMIPELKTLLDEKRTN